MRARTNDDEVSLTLTVRQFEQLPPDLRIRLEEYIPVMHGSQLRYALPVGLAGTIQRIVTAQPVAATVPEWTQLALL